MKKIIAMTLTFAMLIMMIPANAYVDEVTIEKDYAAEFLKNTPAKDFETVQHDFSLLSAVSLSPEIVDSYSTSPSGEKIYKLRLTDEIVSYISIAEDEEGIILNITEGDDHNVVKFSDQGDMYINNNLVEIIIDSSPDSEKAELVSNDWYSYYYDESYDSPSNYNIQVASESSADVKLGESFKNITVTALALVIGRFVAKLDWKVGAGVTVLSYIATQVKSNGERFEPDSAYLSYRLTKYKNPNETPITRYYRYYGVYYSKRNYQGTATYTNAYEYMYQA